MSVTRLIILSTILLLTSQINIIEQNVSVQIFPPSNPTQGVDGTLSQPGFQSGSMFSSTTLSSGDEYSCGIDWNATLSCWGPAYSITGLSELGIRQRATQISSYDTHTCALIDNGTINCWNVSSGHLTTPVEKPLIAVSLDVGSDESCSILSDASIVCWDNSIGDSQYIQLGGKGAVAISSGGNESCAIMHDQDLYCWPFGGSPQLRRTGDVSAVAVSMGEDHGCALLQNMELSCWGSNLDGQTSIAVTASNAISLSAGAHHTCVLLSDASISCSGDNSVGQSSISLQANEVPVALSAGHDHTCVALLDGSTRCYGLSSQSLEKVRLSERDLDQDGVLNIFDVHMPGYAGDSIGSSSPIAMGMKHTCAVMSNRSLSCWGYNMHGQLGLGLGAWAEVNAPQPIDFGFDEKVWSIAADGHQTCAIMDNGSLWCWGLNTKGQLGIGSTEKKFTPQAVDLGLNRSATAVTIGNSHTCAITNDSTVLCWGWNNFGQLGINTSSSSELSPQEVHLPQGLTPISLAAGNAHTCSVMSNGSLWCWGLNNFGQNGLGQSIASSPYPQHVPFPEDSTIITAVANRHQTCAITENRSLFCWGDDEYGQLGLGNVGSGHQQYSPQHVDLGGLEVLSFSGGDRHSCAILGDYTMWCWGQNSDGQLGLGNNTHQGSPIHIPVDVNGSAVVMTGGTGHSCAILNDGTLKCWGANDWGQLGVGNRTPLMAPHSVHDSANLTFHRGDLDPDGDGLPYHSDSHPLNPARSVECGPGEYGIHRCISANPGHWTNETGAIVQSQCLPGTYQPAAGSTGCITSDPGNFTDSAAMIWQYPCLNGTYQNMSGQAECNIASPGYYVNHTGSTMQYPCPEGSYQPLAGRPSCIAVSPGHFTNESKQTKQIPCPSGTYQPNAGSDKCKLTDRGNYTGSSGMSNQVACNNGTYQNDSGQAECLPADPGYFAEGFGSTKQHPCDAGTFQPRTSSQSCVDATAGHFVSSSAQPSQTPCPEGQYQPLNGQIICIEADPGSHVSAKGANMQVPCLPGTYQPTSGSKLCIKAAPGFYVAEKGQTMQTPCPANEEQPLSGQTSCSAMNDMQMFLIAGGVTISGLITAIMLILTLKRKNSKRKNQDQKDIEKMEFDVSKWV